MAKKSAPRPEALFFDVIYEDGARTSNRKVIGVDLAGHGGEAAVRAIIEEQDRKIRESSGIARGNIKSVKRVKGR